MDRSEPPRTAHLEGAEDHSTTRLLVCRDCRSKNPHQLTEAASALGLSISVHETKCLKACDEGPVCVVRPSTPSADVWVGDLKDRKAIRQFVAKLAKGDIDQEFAPTAKSKKRSER